MLSFSPNVRYVALLAVLLGTFLLAGCQATPDPQKPGQIVAATFSNIETVADAVSNAHDNDLISDAQLLEFVDRLDRAYTLAIAAEAARGTGDGTLEQNLVLVEAILIEIQAQLRAAEETQ